MESYEYLGSYFDAFPPESKSFVMNLYCQSAREFTEGTATVEELLRSVGARCIRGYREGTPRAQLLETVRASLTTDEAKKLAAFVIQRERLTPELKKKLKIERASSYRAKWMAEHPASPKQLALLRKLGHSEIPASLAEASALIDALLKANKAA